MAAVFLIVLVLGVTWTGQGLNIDTDKRFLVVFGPSGMNNHIPREIHVINHDSVAGTVNISKFIKGHIDADVATFMNTLHLNVSESRRIPVANKNNFNLNTMTNKKFLFENMYERTFLIEADIKISVFAVNKNNASTDSFLVLPVAGLGKQYVVPSWNREYFGLGYGLSFLVIAAVSSDEFSIHLTFPWQMEEPRKTQFAMLYKYKNPLSFTLNAFDFFTMKSRGSSIQIMTDLDLTGTIITSDKPIAVVSGNERTSIFGNETIIVNGTEWDKYSSDEKVINGTTWKNSFDHIEEMIPPVSTWGKHFVTVPLAERMSGDVFRILASKINTQVKVQRYQSSRSRRDMSAKKVHLKSTQTYTIAQEGEYLLQYAASDEYLILEASEQILLVQYSKSSTADFTEGDPFMIIVPPVEQYANTYVSTTFKGVISEEYTNFIAVVIASNQTNGLSFDEGFSQGENGASWLELGDSGFSAMTLCIAPGRHSLRHSDPTATFMVLSYGHVKYEAYGHPAGMRYSPLYSYCQPTLTVSGDGIDNDCDARIDEEIANGFDDDGDGRVDEDLAEFLPSTTTASTTELSTTGQPGSHQLTTDETPHTTTTHDTDISTETFIDGLFSTTQTVATVTQPSYTAKEKSHSSKQSIGGFEPGILAVIIVAASLVALSCSIGLAALIRKCKRKEEKEEVEDAMAASRRSSDATLVNAKQTFPRRVSHIHLSLDADEGIGSLHEADEVFALPEEVSNGQPPVVKPREAWSRNTSPVQEEPEETDNYRGRRGKRNSVTPLTPMDF